MFSTEKSIWIDNYQKITAEPQWNPACVIPMDLQFEHVFWSEKNVPQHWKYFFFSILLDSYGDLLIYLSGFLKHLGRKDTALNYLRETGLKLKFQNWRFIQ